jgi:serine/threonine protein kinase
LSEGNLQECLGEDPEQHSPVRRQVALKVIKPGMDSRQVIARFEAERQALALMDHPIARILDGGTPPLGPTLLRHGTGHLWLRLAHDTRWALVSWP